MIDTPSRPNRPSVSSEVQIRPRTAGEILDDAGRLALADGSLLLAVSGLFTVPAATAFFLLLTLPAPEGLAQLILPATTALFLPLTGLGSAACQAVFRARGEGKSITLSGCLVQTLRRGLDHVTGRALVWALTLFGSLILILPPALLFSGLLTLGNLFDSLTGLLVRLLTIAIGLTAVQGLAACAGSIGIHPLLAGGDHHCFGAWVAAVREAQRQAGKVAVVVVSRPFLWMIAFINLHLLIHGALWAGDSLAGLDLALPSLVLTAANPAYLIALALLVWLLLVPYFEATNYLLHADARARYEGLDLWYQVRRLFPIGGKGAAVATVLLLWAALPAFAADSRLQTVQTARKDLQKIAEEIQVARRYQAEDWLPALRTIGEELDADGANRRGRYRWFDQALRDFEKKKRAAALQIIAGLDRRLALIEQELLQPLETREPAAEKAARSKDDIRAVLPADSADPVQPPKQPRNQVRRENSEVNRPVRREDSAPREEPLNRQRPNRQGPGVIGPQTSGDSGMLMWLAVAVGTGLLAVVAVWFVRHKTRSEKGPAAQQANPDELSLESLMNQAQRQGGEGLWGQADELARIGRFRDAVRSLYLAVLASLHRADLIRYAPTRTNGEYVRQLRSREEVCGPFRSLTGLFENQWYGERSCEPADYDRCRRLAEEIRHETTRK